MSPDKIIVIITGIALIGLIIRYFLMRPEEKEGAQDAKVIVKE